MPDQGAYRAIVLLANRNHPPVARFVAWLRAEAALVNEAQANAVAFQWRISRSRSIACPSDSSRQRIRSSRSNLDRGNRGQDTAAGNRKLFDADLGQPVLEMSALYQATQKQGVGLRAI